jgi:hypothetical protein
MILILTVLTLLATLGWRRRGAAGAAGQVNGEEAVR